MQSATLGPTPGSVQSAVLACSYGTCLRLSSSKVFSKIRFEVSLTYLAR